MALSFAHGAVQWLSTDAVNTTYVVTGLGFQPKAIRFYWIGIQSATDAASTTVHSRRGIGFATSTSDRRCVGSYDEDAAPSMICGNGYRADAVAVLLDGTTTPTAMLDISAIGSDGFTLIVDDQAPVSITIFWEAWGGADITSAATGEISEPAATGNQDYTVTGSFQPSVVMFAGGQATGSSPTAEAQDSGLCVGFASSGNSANNVVVLGNSDTGSANSDTDGYALSGECIAMITVAGGNPNARAQMTQFNSTGFRLNWIARGVTNRKYIYLAIKGGLWNAGGLTMVGTAVGSTASVSGLSYQPVGISLFGRRAVADTAGTSTAPDLITLGSGTSTTSRRSMSVSSADGAGSALISMSVQYDQIFADVILAGALLDINSINSDGFTLIRESATGTANEWYGYLTFGSDPANNALIGASTVAFANNSTIGGSGSLIGATAPTFSNTSTIGGAGSLIGASPITFSPSSSMLALLEAIGSTTFSFSDTATIQGSGSLIGAGTILFADTSTIEGAGSLIGAIPVTFSNSSQIIGYLDSIGSLTWAFSPSGEMAALLEAFGASQILFTPSSVIQADGSLVAVGTFAFSPSSSLGGDLTAFGSSSFTFNPIAAIQGVGELIGAGTSAFTIGSILDGSGGLVGSSVVVFVLDGNLEAALPDFMNGTCAVVFASSGLIQAAGELIGQISPVFSLGAVIEGSGGLIGQSSPLFTTGGVIIATGSLIGQSLPVFTPIAVIQAAGSLIGQISPIFSPGGVITGFGDLIGQSGPAFSMNGIIQGSGDLLGQMAMVFDPGGLIGGLLDLSGTLSMQFGSQADIYGLIEGRGTTGFQFVAASNMDSLNSIEGVVSFIFANQGIIDGNGSLIGASDLVFMINGVPVLTAKPYRVIIIN